MITESESKRRGHAARSPSGKRASTSEEPLLHCDDGRKPNRRVTFFQRNESSKWQVRFHAGGQWHRRTTGTEDIEQALIIAAAWIKQIKRRGKPTTTTTKADEK